MGENHDIQSSVQILDCSAPSFARARPLYGLNFTVKNNFFSTDYWITIYCSRSRSKLPDSIWLPVCYVYT